MNEACLIKFKCNALKNELKRNDRKRHDAS